MKLNNRIIAFSIPLCLLVAMAANSRIDPARSIKWPTGAAGCVYAPASNTCVSVGVSSIDAQTGAFTFGGAGVSHIGNAYTFSGTGSGVTSVGLTVPSWLTVAGSPITTSGTLAVTGTSEAQNLFLASPNGSSGAMTPRAIVVADVPTLNQNTTGTAGGFTGNPSASVTNLTILGTCTGCPGTSGVVSIDAQTGAFTFAGAGVSHIGNAYTFSGAGSGVTSINSTSGAFTFTGSLVSCTTTTCTFALPANIAPTSVHATTYYTDLEFCPNGGTFPSCTACTTAATIDPANGNKQRIVLTAGDTCALTFTQPVAKSANVQVAVIQSSSGGFNGLISGCTWPGGAGGGAAPTITQTSGAVDSFTAYLDSSTAKCQIAQAFN